MHLIVRASLAIVLLGGVAACNRDLKAAVEEKLKDPYSVKYEEILRMGSRACVRYNAKNSYGAYSGFTTAHLQDLGGGNWYAETESDSPCTTWELEKKLAIDAADRKAEQQVLAVLKKKKLLPATATESDLIGEYRCSDVVSNVMSYARLRNEAEGEEDKADWNGKFNSGLAAIEEGNCPAPEQATESDASSAAAAAQAAAEAADAAAAAAGL